MTPLQTEVDRCCDGKGLNIVRLRRLFSLFAQDLFSATDNLGEYSEALACLSYNTENPNAGQLYIGPTFTKDARDKDPSSAVYVTVKTMDLAKVGLGNVVAVSADRATTTYVKKANAKIVYKVKYPDADIAIMMGESLVVYLEALRPTLVKYLPGLLGYDVLGMGEVQRDKENPEERFNVDVAVQVEYQLLVSVTQESLLLKKFGFAVTVS